MTRKSLSRSEKGCGQITKFYKYLRNYGPLIIDPEATAENVACNYGQIHYTKNDLDDPGFSRLLNHDVGNLFSHQTDDVADPPRQSRLKKSTLF